MNQRKFNSSRWYALGLAVILMAGCMMLSIGRAFARYRLDSEVDIRFTNRMAVRLGTMVEDAFVPDAAPEWTEIWLPDGSAAVLDFAIYNDPEYGEDAMVRIRLVGSLNAWNPTGNPIMTITDGTLLEDGTKQTWTATAEPIGTDTALYHTFGSGWVFRFLDENGQELTWDLNIGDWKQMQIILGGTAVRDTNLLQLQISSERTP